MATIREIAAKAGISPGAVSRILNNDLTLNVQPKTRQKVLDIAAELGYEKRGYKKYNDGQKAFGILVWYTPDQELNDPYYLSIRLGAESYLSDHRIKIVRAFRTDSDYMSLLNNVDGLICIGKFSKKDISSFEKITNNIILVDMSTNRVDYLSISLDFENAVVDVLEYMRCKGYKEIGYLGGVEYLDGSDSAQDLYPDMRRHVFRDYCDKHGIIYDKYILEDEFTSEGGYRMMSKLISENRVPSAIFAASDTIAIGAMRALTENGYIIPKDVAIIGFDDISQSAFTTPPLTTVHAPAYEMGIYAADSLVSHYMLSQLTNLPVHITLPCHLVIRESC